MYKKIAASVYLGYGAMTALRVLDQPTASRAPPIKKLAAFAVITFAWPFLLCAD